MSRRDRATELFERFVNGGEATIDQFISEQISEELFIDYKRVTSNGASAKLEQSDRENLARAIAGFGNTEGGIIIWGVDCRDDGVRGDVPTTKHPIQKVRRFVSYMEGATSGCTIPPHDEVRHHVIERPESDDGFVITLISKSMFAPHQCIVGKHKGRYHVRIGSNFEQASHGLLAGMFGKRQSPNIFHMWQLGGGVSAERDPLVASSRPTSTPYALGKLVQRNHGPSVAKDLYVNYNFSLPGPNCVVRPRNVKEWSHSQSVLDWRHIIAPEGYRLPPGGMVIPVDLQLFLKPPFDQRFWYEISFGCEGSQVFRIIHTVSAEDLATAYTTFVETDHGHEPGRDLAKIVFGAARKSEYEEGFD